MPATTKQQPSKTPKSGLNSKKRKTVGNELTAFDQSYRQQGFDLVAGVDEAGRGPLAGPVVTAAILVPPDFFIPEVNDSKQVTPKIRDKIYDQLTNTPDIYYGVGTADHLVIDELNIYQATIYAMRIAIDNLVKSAGFTPDLLLLDGISFSHDIKTEKVLQGDAKSFSIAAASIIAKVIRDQIMTDYDKKYPEYGFATHKGYGTKKHLDAINQFGPTEIHRRSFEPIKSMVLVGERAHE